jgi:hypothetical protein
MITSGRRGCVGLTVLLRDIINIYKNIVIKPERKEPHGRCRRGCGIILKRILRKQVLGCGLKERGWWPAVVNRVVNLLIP